MVKENSMYLCLFRLKLGLSEGFKENLIGLCLKLCSLLEVVLSMYLCVC